jgi:hypothetical protein
MKVCIRFIVSTLVFVTGLGTVSWAQSPDFHIYLGLGQSNMEGGPKVTGLAQVDPRFQVMAAMNCPSLTPPRTQGKWYPANPPLPRCSAGPGIVDWFGRTLIDSLPANIKIGVIMVTIIGTKIEVFDKATYQTYLNDPTTEVWLRNYAKDYNSNPYERLIEVAKIAQKDGVIKGILLHQGESNVGDANWPEKVKKIYNDLMTDLSLDPKSVSLLAGEVVNADMNGAAAGINEQINRLPAVLPNSYVISSSKLPAGGDKLHFTADGHKLFGQRYASTMLSILKQTTGVQTIATDARGFHLGFIRNGMARGNATLDFTIPQAAHVSLKMWTPAGKEIAEMAGANFESGRHTLKVPSSLPAGLVILKMTVGRFAVSKMVTLD